MSEARKLLLGLIRGDSITTAEIEAHLKRLVRHKVELPKGWDRWPEELRAMEREGVVVQVGGIWAIVPASTKGKQNALF